MSTEDRAPARCHFVPPYLLQHLASEESADAPVDPATVAIVERTLRQDEDFRAERRAAGPATPAVGGRPAWTVHTAAGGTSLPGAPVRSAGEPASGDDAVDEAAYGGQGALDLFSEVYGRASYDGAGAPVVMTVHYGRSYDNAFWNGTQLVFGDGDGRLFDRFTKPVDVLGHELTHAVTEHTAGLVYRDQPGALNESVSDVFAACTKQRLLEQTAAEADWLIGAGLFLSGVNARGLRDMANPGTAYDDPRLGRDPQPAHLRDYIQTSDDNGGVHLNSGIPNRAFYLAATTIGGTSWDGAGAIWYAALTGGDVGPVTDFAGFAAATLAAAGDHAEAVAGAWAQVGVTVGGGSTPDDPPAPGGDVVEIRRTGGFAGLTTTGTVDLASTDPRVAEVRSLMERIDVPAEAAGGTAYPDMYQFAVRLPGREEVLVSEQDLSEDLRRLVDVVLRHDRF
jgi:Thermolysin metallopeptidase, alpha-helical domain/Thermolysin metallopeptidase, catalytic domain/Emfourin